MIGNEKKITFDKKEIRANTKVAFDVDLTLIDHEDRPLYDNITLLRWFVDRGFDVIVWSGGGSDGPGSYAAMHMRRLGFEDKVRIIPKGSEQVDLAFDDEEFSLAKANILVE